MTIIVMALIRKTSEQNHINCAISLQKSMEHFILMIVILLNVMAQWQEDGFTKESIDIDGVSIGAGNLQSSL
jgi:hypothetical protein